VGERLLHVATPPFAAALARERLFGAPLFAGLHVIGVPLDIFDDIFLLHFPFEAPKGALQGFAILDGDLCQARFTPFRFENPIVRARPGAEIGDNLTIVPKLRPSRAWGRFCYKSCSMQDLVAVLLAGGAGERLIPLTRHIAKPAVPFGGSYRIIDFTLSNCINSGVRRILILTQYKPLELNRHVRDGWNILSPELGEYIEVLPPMRRMRDDWYLGTADAVYQNIESLLVENPSQTLIVSGDHIYKMNYGEMMAWHREHSADVTLATIQLPPDEAPRFGVLEMNEKYQVVGFEEKPAHGNPKRSVFDPNCISVSMGVYIFDTRILIEALMADASCPNSFHDFGKDVIPALISSRTVVAYDFHDLNAKRNHYWRDVGTIDAYYEANMDLVSVTPEFNLYDRNWPLRSYVPQYPPAKFVFAQEGRRMGVAIDSIVSPGCIVSGGRVLRSVLSPGVRVNSYCEVEDSILLPEVSVGRYSRVRRAIVDSGVSIPEASVIGFNRDEDLANGHHVSESGVVVVANHRQMPTQGPGEDAEQRQG
jgi:glucose-1-phosphate adenylyltransferase